MDPDSEFNLEGAEKKMSDFEQENSYLKNRNLGLSEAVESNFLPKIDSNIIEFKLSSEELLERIEHYLRGDVLKQKKSEDENGEIESYYAIPSKKITVKLFQEKSSKIVYVVDEHPGENSKDWEVLSMIQEEEGEIQEIAIEDNYKSSLLKEIKEGIEGKKKKFISKGYATKEVPDNERINLNEYGVAEVMNTLSMYINKETFLSWYKEDRINEIMADLGDKLNEFLYINGKKMGLDTEYKKTKYPMMVVTILNVVESAYRRAIMGNENRGTREGIIITQHDNPQSGNLQMQVQKKKWSAFDKSTW